ncbi:hypothetical protein A0H81_06843 [Grifola frondosa]|uniref:Uncharacterized protein n=1 Tax=Grifola frondosa TaxID=5627 RepID=A0A1C7M903_GRIFR|nr:hypothetical protein A0H81_06843 [Grifola frondosa]
MPRQNIPPNFALGPLLTYTSVVLTISWHSDLVLGSIVLQIFCDIQFGHPEPGSITYEILYSQMTCDTCPPLITNSVIYDLSLLTVLSVHVSDPSASSAS